MKNLLSILAILMFSIFIIGCSEDDEPNEVGGDTNIPINQVGNEFSTVVNVAGTYADLKEDIKIASNDNGIITLDVEADLSGIPALAAVNDMIPSHMKNADGKLKTQVRFKSTSEGIQDFFNKDQKAHTMVKYDCNVGDSYTLTKSDGKTITRSVTAKSNQDDFPYGFMYIKTTTVVQDSRIPGVSHFEYRFNHKFGLVHFKMVFEDGTDASSYVMTQNY